MAPTFQTFGTSFVANGVTAGDQTDAGVGRLPDGSFFQLYSSPGEVRLAHFAVDGSRIGNDVLVATPSGTSFSANYDFTSDGKVVVNWVDTVTTAVGTTSTLYGRTFNIDLTPATSQFAIATDVDPTGPNGQSIPVTNATGTQLFFTWTTKAGSLPGDTTGRALAGRLMNLDGTPASAEFQVNTTTSGDQQRGRSRLLSNGNVITLFASADGTGGAWVPRARIFQPNGTPVGSDFQINTTAGTSGTQARIQGAALGNGTFLATWESGDTGDGSGTCIRYRFLDANGTPIGASDAILNTTTSGSQRGPVVRPLPNGGAAVVWASFEGASGNVTYRARVMNSDGTWAGSDQIIASGTYTPASNIPNYDFRYVGNGQYVFSWSSPSAGGSTDDGSGNGVRSQIFVLADTGDLVAYGTSNTPQLIGGSGSNYLHAALAGTELVGGSGPNYLIGGAGADILDAGSGSNILFGGAGDDTIFIYPTSNLTNAVIEGGLYIDAALNSGERNQLKIDNQGTSASFDFRTATIDGITDISDVSTTGSDTVTLPASLFTPSAGNDLKTVGVAGDASNSQFANVTFNVIADPSKPVSVIDFSNLTYLGFASGDSIVADASNLTTAVTIKAASIQNSTLKGGAGNDTFVAGSAGSQAILGNAGVDTAIIPGNRSNFLVSKSGATTTITRGTISRVTLTGVENIQFSDVSQRSLTPPRSDFNANGVDDVLFQDASGNVANWTLSNGQFQAYNGLGGAGAFKVVGTGDVNADGTSDIVFQDGSGNVADWTLSNGQFASYNNLGSAGGYKVVAVGDVNADGTSDLIFQNDSGQVADWTLQNGQFASYNNVGNAGSYKVVGSGDFNNDGTADLVFQNTNGQVAIWTLQNGQFASYSNVGNAGSYKVVGVGDVNVDGTADLVFQEPTSGQVATWTVQNAAFSGYNNVGNAGSFSAVGVKDVNGDGASDLLFQNAGGQVASWTLQNGQFQAYNNVGNAGGFKAS
jgi:hypothetical protein